MNVIKASVVKKSFNLKYLIEPHIAFLSYFNLDHMPEIITGSFKYFRLKLFFTTLAFMTFILFYYNYIPKWYEVIITLIFLYLIVNSITYLSHHFFGTEETKSHIKNH
jgi:Ca2+/Na+ antiporter